MKRLLLILIMLSVGFSAQAQKKEKQSRKEKREAALAEIAMMYEKILKTNEFDFYATEVIGQQLQTTIIENFQSPSTKGLSGYFVKVKDGELNCHLPFMGETKVATLTGVTIKFETDKYSILSCDKLSRDGWLIEIKCKDPQINRQYTMLFNIDLNGEVYMQCGMTALDAMKYKGYIEISE